MSPRFLSFAIPIAIIVLSLIARGVTRAVEQSYAPDPSRGRTAFWGWLGLAFVLVLAVLATATHLAALVQGE